ncbi:MAG: peptide deformylase [Chlamydiae bacterium]|nr:peptide deformylase [Chlamydiota bacterium]
MAKRHLVYYGDPVLRKQAEPVKEVNDEVRLLIRDMLSIMEEHRGIGLAANQVGALLRVFISTVTGMDKEGFPIYGEPKIYINPTVTVLDDTPCIEQEGCLSIPKIYEDVARPKKIRIEALDENGSPFMEEKEGWEARPLLHENDHLNGVLFIDRIAPHRRQALQAQLKRIKKKHL